MIKLVCVDTLARQTRSPAKNAARDVDLSTSRVTRTVLTKSTRNASAHPLRTVLRRAAAETTSDKRLPQPRAARDSNHGRGRESPAPLRHPAGHGRHGLPLLVRVRVDVRRLLCGPVRASTWTSKTLYKVNSSLCFAGVSSGMFFCFLSGWGALLTLRRRASVMGFGHFFGSCCVSFLVAVQAAGMWGAEATLLEEFGARKIYEEAIVDGMYEQVRVRPEQSVAQSL